MEDDTLDNTLTSKKTDQKKVYDPKRRRAMFDMLVSGMDARKVKFIHTMSGFDEEEADNAIDTFYRTIGQKNPYSPKEQNGVKADVDLSVIDTTKQEGKEMAGAVSQINQLEKLARKLNTESGIGARISGVKKSAGAFLGTDVDSETYSDLVQNIGLVARSLGNKGVLTDVDVERIVKSLPELNDSKDVTENKLAFLKQTFNDVAGGAVFLKKDEEGAQRIDSNQNINLNTPEEASQWLSQFPDDPRVGQVKSQLEAVGYMSKQPTIVDETDEVKTSGFFDGGGTGEKIGQGLGSFFGGNQIGKALGDVAGATFAKYGEAGETFKNTIAMLTKAHQEGKLSDEKFQQQLDVQEKAAQDAFGYSGPSFKQLAADAGKIALSVTGGPALKGAFALGTAGRVIGMGALQGVLEEVASEKDATLGGVAMKAGIGAVAAPVLYGGLAGVGKIINIATGKNALLKLSKNTAKAIGMTGKMTAASSQQKIPQALSGISAIAEEAKGSMVRDMDGIEKAFDPSNVSYGETVQALVTAKNNVYKKYTALAKQAGDTGASVTSSDIEKVIGSLQEEAKNATGATKSKVMSIINDIVENFGENGKLKDSVDFGSMQKYIEALNVDVNPMSDKAGAVVSGKASKLFRDILDDKISGATGQEYQMLRNKYASLKGVEDSLVNQFKKSARGTGSGVSDWVNGVGGADMLAGAITANPAQFTKGAALSGMSKLVKRMRDPETALKSVFKVIEKQATKEGGYSGIAQRAAEAQGFGVVGKTIQSMNKKISGGVKKIRPGMNIQDVSGGKAGYSGKLHPDDSKALTEYIDAVRLKKTETLPKGKAGAEYIFEKLGINPDQSTSKLANIAEDILTGKRDSSALYKTGREFKTVLSKKGKGAIPKIAKKTLTSESTLLQGAKKLYHVTEKKNIESILKDGFKGEFTDETKHYKGFSFFAEDKKIARSFGKILSLSKDRGIVEANLAGNVLDVGTSRNDFSAVLKAQKKLGIKANEIDIESFKQAMTEKGYSAIRFNDITASLVNGKKAPSVIMALDEKVRPQLIDLWKKAHKK